MEMKREGEIDPYEDARDYVGQNSFFIANDTEYIDKQENKHRQEEKKATLGLISDFSTKALKPTEAITSMAGFSEKNS